MGVPIENVSIISVCTIGRHTHYEYIYNGYVHSLGIFIFCA